jgi:hypothetical protein
VDLATVSVLVDAGAGHQWKYTDVNGQVFQRSEGLAVASLAMFKDGCFSSDAQCVPHRVNSVGLRNLTLQDFNRGFQISKANPMSGGKNRFQLLQRLADVLESNAEYFGSEICRPGHIVDYVLRNKAADGTCSVRVLWRAISEGLEKIWPESMSGVKRGDVHVYNPLKKAGVSFSDVVPFHKLSQWLALSLLEPLEAVGVTWTDVSLFTCLAEYRNGGLFVDTGIIVAKDSIVPELYYDVGSELIVEWRALTVCIFDALAPVVRAKLGLDETSLSLPKLLQGGTWSAGRVMAREKRPETGVSPILIRSDGCVF